MIPFVYFFLTTVKFYFKKTVKFILFFLADKTKDYIIAFLVGKKNAGVDYIAPTSDKSLPWTGMHRECVDIAHILQSWHGFNVGPVQYCLISRIVGNFT